MRAAPMYIDMRQVSLLAKDELRKPRLCVISELMREMNALYNKIPAAKESRMACARMEGAEFGLMDTLTPIPIATPTGVVNANTRPISNGLMALRKSISLIRVPKAIPSKN